MSISRWDPFRDLLSLQERMNRLFEDSLSRTKHPDEDILSASWTPLVDIYETDTHVVMKAELPGMSKEDISVEVKENMLILMGERKFQKNVKEENYHRLERNYGKFQRAFTLPFEVDRSKIEAHYRDGVLEVTLPKTESSKPKQIEIKVR